MIVDYSKDFERTVRKLSGKRLESVRDTIRQVKQAQKLTDITNCIKIGRSRLHLSYSYRELSGFL